MNEELRIENNVHPYVTAVRFTPPGPARLVVRPLARHRHETESCQHLSRSRCGVVVLWLLWFTEFSGHVCGSRSDPSRLYRRPSRWFGIVRRLTRIHFLSMTQIDLRPS